MTADTGRISWLKDPEATVDYAVDWQEGGYLGEPPNLRAVVGSTWHVSPVEPGGLDVSGSLLAGNVATCFVSGGIVGHSYMLTNRAQISNGAHDERSILIRVEQR